MLSNLIFGLGLNMTNMTTLFTNLLKSKVGCGLRGYHLSYVDLQVQIRLIFRYAPNLINPTRGKYETCTKIRLIVGNDEYYSEYWTKLSYS